MLRTGLLIAMEIQQVIEKYFKDTVANNKKPTISGFLEANEEFVTNLDIEGDPTTFWSTQVKQVALDSKVNLGRSKSIKWNNFQKKETSQSPSNTRSSSSSKRSRSTSKVDSCPMSEVMMDEYHATHAKLQDSKKWKLKNGEYVEDIMHEYGSQCDHQHLVHSYILDIDDPIWSPKFSEEQLEEIRSAGRPALPELGEGVKKIFKICSDTLAPFLSASSLSSSAAATLDEKVLIDAIDTAIRDCGQFDPYAEYDERRLQRTLQEFLDMYRFDVLGWVGNCGSEADFVANIWSLLDRTFQNLGVQTRRDQTSLATKLDDNRDRAITGFGPVGAQQTSFRPDLVLFRDGNEYGAAECGKADTAGIGKKEVIESQLHCPKVLKSMMNLAGSKTDNDEETIRSIRIVGFIQFHLQMRVSILDCPVGYVCRLRTTPTYDISTRASMMTTGLLPILKLTWKAKAAVWESIKSVEQQMRKNADEDPDVKCSKKQTRKLILPPVARSREKKQKVEE